MVKKTKTTKKTKTKSKSKKTKSKSAKNIPLDNNSIVIVDDELTIDKEKEMEERRAYLEEARSQEASD